MVRTLTDADVEAVVSQLIGRTGGSLLPFQLGTQLTTFVHDFTSGAQFSSLVAANPNRVALVFGCTTGTVDVAPAVSGQPPGGQGFVVNSSTNPIVLTINDVGPLVQFQWVLTQAISTAHLTVWEIVWRPSS